MNLKQYFASRRAIVAGVIAVVFCLIGLVYSDPFASKSPATLPQPSALNYGVSEISKPFSYALNKPEGHAPGAVVVSAEMLRIPEDMTRSELAASYPENLSPAVVDAIHAPAPAVVEIARPGAVFLRGSIPGFAPLPTMASHVPARRQSAAKAAARALDAPFNSLFAEVFKREGDDPGAHETPGHRDEGRNPFSEARQKAETEAQPAPAAVAATPEPAKTTTPPAAKDTPPPAEKDDKASNTAPPAAAAKASGPRPRSLDGPFLVIGDFDGTGALAAAGASRVDEGTFAFSDGRRTFSLYINPAAVELQRSFAIDDFNGDGNPDLLVTSRAALFGAVLAGDGAGGFHLVDSFLTGYEPTVPVSGLLRGDQRDILSVNLRTGTVTTFRKQDRYSRTLDQGLITFLPDVVGIVAGLETGTDRFMAAQTGKSPQVYQWQDDGRLAASSEDLPAEPGIAVAKDFLRESAMGSLQVYQVGSTATALLTTSRRQSFNVANLRVSPKVFLVFGDILKRGTLDVAVACLLDSSASTK